ncbi:MAG TPA: MarR family transcriptional regulator [Streptosporangiaceae bacterium]
MAQEGPLADLSPLASTGYLLARLGMESRRIWGQMLTEHGLTPHQFGVLSALDKLGAQSQQQLGRAIGVDPRNAVPIIDALEQRGLLERRPDPADRRKHAITLTRAGHIKIEQLGQSGSEIEESFLASLTDQERDRLHATLSKLFAALTSPAK